MVSSTQILKIHQTQVTPQSDLVVTEEPLEIRLIYGKAQGEQSLAITMRTPGDDLMLAIGFLLSEGMIRSKEDVKSVKHCEQVKEEAKGNVVKVSIRADVEVDIRKMERHVYMSSSCGICGKASLDAVEQQICHFPQLDTPKLDATLFYELPKRMQAAQTAFKHTGGIHAAALFDVKGNLLLVREDVGRHNAVDKVLGTCLWKGIDVSDKVLLVSGRAGFELIQKAAVAGVPIFAAIGAPSSLAVDLAKKAAMTLIGFLKPHKMNIYHGQERIYLGNLH